MEVKIGVQNVARELSVDVDESSEDVLGKLTQALKDNAVFALSDPKGSTVAVPAEKVAYLHFTSESGRKVGFGLNAGL